VTIDVQLGMIVCLSHNDETKLSNTTDDVTSAKRAWKDTAGSWHVLIRKRGTRHTGIG